MRILFAGSSSIAVPSLERLFSMHGQGTAELVGVLTNVDAPRGRRGIPEPTDAGAAAAELSAKPGQIAIPVLKPEKLGAAFREEVMALKPDLLVSFAYGKIFGPKFLGLFPLGGINIHPSLLPKYRGPAPIPAAILHRDRETGISVQRLALEMDAGDILLQETLPLDGRETTGSLSGIVALKSADLLERVIRQFDEGSREGKPQDPAAASYCSLIQKDDGIISWNRSALDIDAQIRAYTPWPLCRTTHNGKDLYILEAAPAKDNPLSQGPVRVGTIIGVDKQAGILVQTKDGILAVQKLQYAAKKAMDWKAFLNGARDFPGSVLG